MANSIWLKIVWKTKKLCHRSSPQLTDWRESSKVHRAVASPAGKSAGRCRRRRALAAAPPREGAVYLWLGCARHLGPLTLLTVVTGQIKLCGPHALDSVRGKRLVILVRRFFFIPIRPFPSIACFLFPSYCPVGERMHLNTKKRSRKKFMQKNLNELRVYNWNSRDLSVHWMLNEGHEPWRGSYSFIGASQFCGTHWALATPGSHPIGEHSIPNKT